jgi:carboxymethylenebutenolidase
MDSSGWERVYCDSMKGLLAVAAVVVLGGAAYWLYTHKPIDMNREADTAVQGEDVRYFEGATGYYVRPATATDAPGIVLIHENRGLRPEIRQAATDLAKEGYQVLAVDLLGSVVETQDEARALTATYDQQQGVANMRAAAQFLREHGAHKIASWGWCFGGSRSLDLALSGEPLDATIIYYGSRPVTDPEQLKVITWPVLGIYGAEDQAIPLATVEEFKKALTEARVDHNINVYAGVGHAFANPSNPNFAPEPTADAWAKSLAFLAQHLK